MAKWGERPEYDSVKIAGSQRAFPLHCCDHMEDAPGMTMRQHYAGLAMQGLLAGDPEVIFALTKIGGGNAELTVAKTAWQMADSMLEAENG